MHIVAFALKRAHQAALRVERPLAARFGLTPARFDMLYCILLHDRTCFRQADLRRALGVTSPTVSRMLKSLKELGLVFRCPDPEDDRQLNVGLTPLGRERIRAAVAATIGEGLPHLGFDVALAGRRWFDEATCVARTRSTTALLRRIAATFYDTGWLDYGITRRPRAVAMVLRPAPDARPRRRRPNRPEWRSVFLVTDAPPAPTAPIASP